MREVGRVNPWVRIDKGDVRARLLADEHYTRQSPGAPMWTRPGYNYCLFAETDPWWGVGTKALWCWWRPKWEDGQERKDGLRAVECTMFRLTSREPWLASDLVQAAVEALDAEDADEDLAHFAVRHLPLITGIGSVQTAARRAKAHLPGHCFRMAGWTEIEHRRGRADIWLQAPAA